MHIFDKEKEDSGFEDFLLKSYLNAVHEKKYLASFSSESPFRIYLAQNHLKEMTDICL